MMELKKNKGQSILEFSIIFPLFLLFVLGMAQLALIFINAMMLKYAAYMSARAAVVRQADERVEYARKAEGILRLMYDAVNNYSGDTSEIAAGTVKNFLARRVIEFASYEEGAAVEETAIESSSAGEFVRVVVSYNMPLKVPVVKNIFGFFQKNFINYGSAYIGFPFYKITASAVMRLE
ncbi:MAG: pilus assembly protein [Candidatus Goldbacteria bacterium]|nr:pilus assembly protein [Candidatus Goldiibacteriota bacterium]